MRRPALVRTGPLVAASLVVAFSTACAAVDATEMQRAETAIVFVSDGMRPDLAERFANDGGMPTLAQMMRHGARGDNGLTPPFPTHSATGWPTLLSGTGANGHGGVSKTFHQIGDPWDHVRTQPPEVLHADTLMNALERAGRRVAAVGWHNGRLIAGTIAGPMVDVGPELSAAGVTTTYVRDSDQPDVIKSLRLDYDVIRLQAAAGWTRVPTSFSPALETTMVVRHDGRPTYDHNVYVYDSTDDGVRNYDRILLTRASSKDGQTSTSGITEGSWAEVKVPIAAGPLAGKTAGMLVKLEELRPDATRFRLYHWAVTRLVATSSENPTLEDDIAGKFPAVNENLYNGVMAGIITEETYAEQALRMEDVRRSIMEFIVRMSRPNVLFVGHALPDAFQHELLGLVTPGAPIFDDANRDGVPDGRVAVRWSVIRDAYRSADITIAKAKAAMSPGTAVFVSSDHGFAPFWRTVDASKPLLDLGLISAAPMSGCRPAADDRIQKAKVCEGGGAHVFLRVQGRDPGGTVTAPEYDELRQRVIDAFLAIRDPEHPQATVIRAALRREELGAVDAGDGNTVNMLDPTRTGDVVVFAAPPYQLESRSRIPGLTIADAPFFYTGAHGYLPTEVDLSRNINIRNAFFAEGPQIKPGAVVGGGRAIDFAPTVAYVLGIDPPRESEGRVMMQALDKR